MTFDMGGGDDRSTPEPAVADPEIERSKQEEKERIAIEEEKEKERKKAIAAGMRGQRSLLSNQYRGFRKSLGSN